MLRWESETSTVYKGTWCCTLAKLFLMSLIVIITLNHHQNAVVGTPIDKSETVTHTEM